MRLFDCLAQIELFKSFSKHKDTISLTNLYILVFIFLYLYITSYLFNNNNAFHLRFFILKSGQSRVFFSFPYISESYQLVFQIKYLYPLISNFVLIWSNISYSGKYIGNPKFEPFCDFLSPFFKNQTITLHYADLTNFSMCKLTNYYFDFPQNKENFHRKCIISSYTLQALKNSGIKENDFFFYGDIDEFPTMECLHYLISNPPSFFYNIPCLYSFYYTFRWECDLKYYKFTFSRFTKNLTQNDIVNFRYLAKPVLAKSEKVQMIHMSTIFPNIEQFKLKYRSYAHSQISNKFRNLNLCDLYLKIIQFYSTKKCRYHKEIMIIPDHIINDPSLKIMFYKLPFKDVYDYFTYKCKKQLNSSIFTTILNKIIN